MALGLLIRLTALPLAGMVDVKAWKAWATQAATEGVARVYGPPDAEILKVAQKRGGPAALLTMPFPRNEYWYRGEYFYVDYPPASMLLLALVGRVHSLFDPQEQNGRIFNLLLNALPFAGAVVIAWVLGRSAPGSRGGWRAVAFWCNPAILLAAILGYQDPLFAVFGLLAVLALSRGSLALGAALVVAAGLLKPQGSLLLPALLVLLVSTPRLRTWVAAGLAGAAVALVVFAPWWTQGYMLSALDGCRRPLAETTLSGQSLNLAWIGGYAVQWLRDGPWPLARILFDGEFAAVAGWHPQPVSRLLLLVGTLANMILLARWPKADAARIPMSVILQTHAYALCGTSVHENHTYLAVVLAPLLLGLWDRARAILALTSAFLFANLFLFEGLGRQVIRDRVIWRLRMMLGLDLTVIVAVLHIALVGLLFAWAIQRTKSNHRDTEAQRTEL